MNFRSRATSLSLLLAISIGTQMPHTALAGGMPHTEKSYASNSAFTSALRELGNLSEDAKKSIFNVKNSKGESIFKASKVKEKDLWATLDPVQDKVEGTSTEKTYQNFKISANSNEIIVAVIDSGVDINHEDLKGHIWLNLPEFYGKPGVDDDGDGFIDDIYGWNFLGNKDGQNVGPSTLEVTRIYAALKARQDAGQILSEEDAALFNQTSTEVEQGIQKAQTLLTRYQSYLDAINLLKANGLTDESVDGIKAVTSQAPDVLQAIKLASFVFEQGATSVELGEGIVEFNNQLKFQYNIAFSSSDIVKDNPAVLDEKGYGNGDVIGPDASHGTHVSGIIGAVRNNFGIDGQALNVKIMPIRAIPDGDERDKDVGNAIRFAVDHGARIINMSFGKAYSPNKNYVDAAVKYAESRGVLLVHAAGNDGKNTESQANNFPNRKVRAGPGTTREIETWIEVGASSKTKGENLPADFSNYGKTSVDLFAPGVGIVSTVPGNKYASFDGTSMASPEVAGVAALLLELFPNATAIETKNAILASSNQYAGLSCDLPGTSDLTDSSGKSLPPTLVNFSDLSATGGTINAYQAMLQMEKL